MMTPTAIVFPMYQGLCGSREPQRLLRWRRAVLAMLADRADATISQPSAIESAVDSADVAAALDGDGDAYRQLVERYQNTIAAQMHRFSRDPGQCEQLVHDVFVEAYLSLGRYRGTAPWLHWLRKIATRVGYRYWKQQRRQPDIGTLSPDQWRQIDARLAGPSEAIDAAELVHTVLAQLPPRDRLVLTLIYLDGCTTAEAAARSGWTVPIVKIQAFRARRKLAKLLQRGEP